MKTKTGEEVRERVTSVYAKTLPDFSARCPCSQNWKASKTCENTNWIYVFFFCYIQSNPPAGTISLPVSLEECHLNLEQLVSCHTAAFHHSWNCVNIFFPPPHSQNKLNKKMPWFVAVGVFSSELVILIYLRGVVQAPCKPTLPPSRTESSA